MLNFGRPLYHHYMKYLINHHQHPFLDKLKETHVNILSFQFLYLIHLHIFLKFTLFYFISRMHPFHKHIPQILIIRGKKNTHTHRHKEYHGHDATFGTRTRTLVRVKRSRSDPKPGEVGGIGAKKRSRREETGG